MPGRESILRGMASVEQGRTPAERAGYRIARNISRLVGRDKTSFRIRTGPLRILDTRHTEEEYAHAAAKLTGEGIEFEAARFTETRIITDAGRVYGHSRMPAGAARVEHQYDIVRVTSIGGVAIEGNPLAESHGYFATLHPRESEEIS